MGGKSSKTADVYIPATEPPPRRVEDDYPVLDPIGIGKGMAQGCQQPGGGVCQLAVPQGVSSSGAKLYRDEGTVRRDQCRKYTKDLQKVASNQKSFEEVKKDLIAGVYYEELPNEYCRQIVYDPEDVKAIRAPNDLPTEKARYMSIRKMSDSGSYSSVTKLFIKPAIPFEIEFNGKPHKVSVMTLLHPSPIRVENVQHDAMLTLGDPSTGNNDGLVILIPLQGAIVAGESGAFINKVVRYMTGVLQPDPATGDYKTIDIPTGNDWDLSKMFPGTPGEAGKTFVTNVGYYVWSGFPPLELRATGSATPSTSSKWFGNWYLRKPGDQRYSWQPSYYGSVQYAMLAKPALVSSFDLQTIRMLPVTPVTEAVSPIMKWTLSYRQPGKMGADGKWESYCAASSSPAGAITDLFSGFGRESMVDMCDPFAPGAFEAPDSTDAFVKMAIVFLTAISVGLAIYLAVLFFTKTKWGQWAAHQGTLAGNYISQASISDTRKQERPDTRFEVTAAMEAAEEAAEAKKKLDEETRGKAEAEKEAAFKAAEKAIEKAKADREAAEAKKAEEAEAKAKAAEEETAKKAEEEKAKATRLAEEKAKADERKRAALGYKAVKPVKPGAPVKPEDVVVEPTLPPPGTPAAAAVEKAGEEAAAEVPPTTPSATVTGDVLPPPGTPAADAIAQAEPQESRAAANYRRAQEVATAAKAAPPTTPSATVTSDALPPPGTPAAAAIAKAGEEAAGTGLFARDELEQSQKEKDDAEAARKASLIESTKRLKAAFKEAEARKQDAEEAKARARKAEEAAANAKIEADEAVNKPKPKAASFAASPAARPSLDERLKTRIEANRKVKEAEEAAEAAQEEAETKEEEQKAAEEAKRIAERASAAFTKQRRAIPKSDDAERKAERDKQAKELAEKDKEEAARAFRPTSGRPSAAVPKAEGAPPPARASREHAPPTEAEVKAAESAIADMAKEVKTAGRPPLPSKGKPKLEEAELKRAKESLAKLQSKIWELWMPSITQNMGLNQALWSNRSVWMRFNEEQKYYQRTLTPAVKDILKFKEAIEASPLDDFNRSGYVTNLKKFTDKAIAALEESKRRMSKLEDNAAPPIFKGGRRRRMQRKSTRRYVA